MYRGFIYAKILSLMRNVQNRKISKILRKRLDSEVEEELQDSSKLSKKHKQSVINIKHKVAGRFPRRNLYFDLLKDDIQNFKTLKNKYLFKYKYFSLVLSKFYKIFKKGVGDDKSLFSETKLSRIGLRKMKMLKGFYAKWFFKVKRLLLFYNNFNFRTLSWLSKRSRVARRNNSSYFLALLERRLDSIVLRTGFFKSKMEVKKSIVLGHILVNGKVVTYCNYITKPNDLISVCVAKRVSVLKALIERLSEKKCPFVLKAPDYMEVNYKTLTCILIPKYIKNSNVFFPFDFSGKSNIKMIYKTKN